MARGNPDVKVEDLERRFDAAMMEIYERAGRELGYWATRYLQLVRARGGLGAARHLLHARATSDGYARLRDEGRLDLTVEAYVLRPEFAPLFTAEEIGLARHRLSFYQRAMEADEKASGPPDPELVRLLTAAAGAPPDRRVDYRDPVADFGRAAIPAVEAWVADGRSPGFACGVLEAIGRRGDEEAAITALRRLRSAHSEWSSVIEPAILRLQAAQRSSLVASAQPSSADVYMATGTPPPAYGSCGIRNRDGTECQNPGRHPVGDVMSCTTHYKAATRRGTAG